MGAIKLNPYIFFQGNAKEAMDFYKGIFGGELNISSFDDMPGKAEMKGMIMHASLTGGDADIMASDSQKASPEAKKISLSISGTDEAKLRKIFDSLAEGGKVGSPLKKEAWGDLFGMLTDKYSIEWMVNITAPKA